MLRIGRRLALLGMLAMAMAACGDDDDDNGTGPTNIAGTYTLRSVNADNSAPFTVIDMTGYRLEIITATVTINSNGTYSDNTRIRETINGTAEAPQDIPSSGTWTRSGSTISFDDSDPDGEDPTATIQNDGTLVFSETFDGTTITARFTK